jgi:hypothetical protein
MNINSKGSSRVERTMSLQHNRTENTVWYLRCMHRFWVPSNCRKGTLSALLSLALVRSHKRGVSKGKIYYFYAARCASSAEADFSFWQPWFDAYSVDGSMRTAHGSLLSHTGAALSFFLSWMCLGWLGAQTTLACINKHDHKTYTWLI